MHASDSPARGIAVMLLAQAIFASTDALQKVLLETVPVMLVVWSRYVVFLLVFAPLLLRQPQRLQASPDRRLMILRGCAFLGATTLMAAALARLPLATTTSLAFVGPFIVLALSALLLGERVGWRRWSATAVGFIGMLIIVRPGVASASVGWPALLVLGATFCWALGVIATRRLGAASDAMTMLLWQTLTGFVLCAPFALMVWQPLSTWEAGWLAVNGIVNLLAQWLTVRALQMAPASMVAPLVYTVIVWATFFGWWLFDALPDGWTLLGALVIIGSGLYVWWRERALRRAALAGPEPG